MIYSIDRFEGYIFVCENEQGKKFEFLRFLLPDDAREGDCVVQNDDGTFSINREETERRKDEIWALQNSLFRHDD